MGGVPLLPIYFMIYYFLSILIHIKILNGSFNVEKMIRFFKEIGIFEEI